MNQKNTRRGFTQSRHAEFISASSRYDNNQILNQFNQTPYYNLTGRGPVVKAAVQDDNIDQTALGFTLIELLVVVLIIGILAAVALPQYQKAVKRAQYAEMLSLITPLAKAAKAYQLQTDTYPTSLADLDIEIPGLDSNGCLKNGICVYFDNNIGRIYVTLGRGGQTCNGYVYHGKQWYSAQPGIYCFQSVEWPGLKSDGMCKGEKIVDNAYGKLHLVE